MYFLPTKNLPRDFFNVYDFKMFWDGIPSNKNFPGDCPISYVRDIGQSPRKYYYVDSNTRQSLREIIVTVG